MAKIESPFKEFPGEIVVPDILDADDFNQWWTRVDEIELDEEETRHDCFLVWDARFHLIKESTLDLGQGYEIERTGLKLPTPLIAIWFAQETNDLIKNATDLKNYLGLSDDT